MIVVVHSTFFFLVFSKTHPVASKLGGGLSGLARGRAVRIHAVCRQGDFGRADPAVGQRLANGLPTTVGLAQRCRRQDCHRQVAPTRERSQARDQPTRSGNHPAHGGR